MVYGINSSDRGSKRNNFLKVGASFYFFVKVWILFKHASWVAITQDTILGKKVKTQADCPSIV